MKKRKVEDVNDDSRRRNKIINETKDRKKEIIFTNDYDDYTRTLSLKRYGKFHTSEGYQIQKYINVIESLIYM